eukprot:8927997-Alexandrium_andersonii.AAC.1
MHAPHCMPAGWPPPPPLVVVQPAYATQEGTALGLLAPPCPCRRATQELGSGIAAAAFAFPLAFAFG